MTRQEFGWLTFGLIVGFLVWEEWRGGHSCTGCGGKRTSAVPITMTSTVSRPVSSFPPPCPPCGGCQ